MNLQEEINELNKQIDVQNKYVKSLIDKLEAATEGEFPQYSDVYWFINDEDVVCCTVYENHQIDRHRQLIRNFFQTEEEAEYALEKLKVEAELWKFSRPFEYGKFNYFLLFDIDGNNFRTDVTSYCPLQGAIYFESEEKVQEAVSIVGKECIKKYIFGVEDL